MKERTQREGHCHNEIWWKSGKLEKWKIGNFHQLFTNEDSLLFEEFDFMQERVT